MTKSHLMRGERGDHVLDHAVGEILLHQAPRKRRSRENHVRTLLQSRTNEAITWLERARNYQPTHPSVRAWLPSAYALYCETERAAAELAEAQRLSVDDRHSSFSRLRAAPYRGVPKIRALFETIFLLGCAKRACRRSDRTPPAPPRRADAGRDRSAWKVPESAKACQQCLQAPVSARNF
jgi:hypothetical protein